MLGLKATAGRALGVEREKHHWGGSGEGECQMQGVRGREAHLGSIALSPPRASPSVTALQLLSSGCHWVEGAGGVLLHQLAVFTLGRGEKKPGCERKRCGEGRKANELPPGFLLCAGWFTCCIAGRALSKCQRRVGPHV